MRALGKEMEIELCQDRPKPVGIERFANLAALVNSQPVEKVVRRAAVGLDERLEEAVPMTPLHLDDAIADDDLDVAGRRLHGADDKRRATAMSGRVRTECRERVVGYTGGHCIERI